jgi:hypothetical protein
VAISKFCVFAQPESEQAKLGGVDLTIDRDSFDQAHEGVD